MKNYEIYEKNCNVLEISNELLKILLILEIFMMIPKFLFQYVVLFKEEVFLVLR